ncbi:MAG: Rrf2 family transcriptional regulator [Candidatus Micrarchaeia archaeon]
MLSITKKADYAVRILAFLSNTPPETFVSSTDISKKTLVPRKFLARIVLDLIHAGWLESNRGSKGGIRLSKKAPEATLGQVVELMDGPIALNECCSPDGKCVFKKTCKIHPVWVSAQAEMRRVLDNCYVVKEARKK